MSDTVLSGRWKVYYGAENRQKRIERDTSVSPTTVDTVNQLYSALQDLFDELGQMDDGVPMSAQTPTEYTIGIIDAGDKDPWFIDRTSVEYLKGGAIKTASWKRVTGSNTGIIRLQVSSNNIVAGDIGFDITGAGNSGTLLDVKDLGSGNAILWIRPDSSAAANDFDDTTTLTCNSHTASFTYNSTNWKTGESLWANIFSLGTIESNTHIYIRQGTGLLQTYDDTSPLSDWWGDGHIDILVNVKEVDIENDEGVVQVFARQPTKTYDHYEVDLSSGGRNPIPLSTGNDLDNQVGNRQMVLTDASGTFTVGEVIQDDSDSRIKGIVTSTSGSAPNVTLQYYLFGDPLMDFSSTTGSFTGQTSGHTATAVNPTDVNAATYTNVVVTHGASYTYDIDENDTPERYSIVVTLSGGGTRTLNQYQQRFKYLTRWGETSTGDTDGLAGQFYIGSDYRIIYNTLTGTINEGDVITQDAYGGVGPATGTVVAHHTAAKLLILRNSRGTFNTTNDLKVGGNSQATMGGSSSATPISPVKASPFGTFAGGKFFGAPGVVIAPTNIASSDQSNFQLIDDFGNVVLPPTKVVITVGNTKQKDKVAVFRLTEAGGDIDKARYSVDEDRSIGATTIKVTPSITVDEPGKTSGGVLRVVDVSAQKEYRIRYASWSGTTFTLDSNDVTAGSGTDSDTIVATGEFTNAKVGDLVLNTTRSNAVSYVTEVVDDDTVNISPAISGQTSGDLIKMNVVPVALEDATPGPADKVYVPFIDSYETADGSETVTITYSANIPIRVRARRSVATNDAIIPFEQDSTVTSTGATVNVIRTPDTIFTK